MSTPTPSSSRRPGRRALATLLGGGLALALCAGEADAQSWQTWAGNLENPKYVQLDYPVAFVATPGHPDQATQTPAHFGLDVISANNPAPNGPNGGLWVVRPDTGGVVKLFPLPSHENVPGLIDTPQGELHKGAVVEPNISEDGRTIYFAYFHDASWKLNGGGWQSLNVSFKGADLYRLDVGPFVDDPSTAPDALAVKRLTFKQYDGPAKSDTTQSITDRFRHAMNPGVSQGTGAFYFGTVDMHPVEMRTQTGLELVWVSNRAMLGNSNFWVSDANHNFNIYKAPILADGSLGPARQFVHYTTTSALSPTPMRNGISFSYQSSTEAYRRWDIQTIDSEGKWGPLIGYGHAAQLFHLGTLVVTTDGQDLTDWFIGEKYYNANDGGFGNLHLLETSTAGINEFVPLAFATEPRQLSEQLTIGAIAKDNPSPTVQVDGQTQYIGKFSSPRNGRLGGEWLMSYTPTSANKWLKDADGLLGQYDAYIAYRPNLQPFEPWEAIDVPGGKGLYTVVRDGSQTYNLCWPTPVLSWQERNGTPQQDFSSSIVDPNTTIPRGEPFAQVGTSSIWNTDVRPYDCYLGNTGTNPYSPNAASNNEEVQLTQNIEGLRYVQDQSDFCQYLLPSTVLGIAVDITSNRPDWTANAYQTDGEGITVNNGKKEAVELLGFYSVVDENQMDQSFMARIPADQPFEFHLIDRNYGMKLVDVRSWHSLQPRETRNDCGGCHQHEAGFGIPFAGTEASLKPPMDMTTQTKFVAYNADCKPIVETSSAPTVQMPEWKADIWPGFSQHCGSCHDANVSVDFAALDAFGYVDELDAYDQLRIRNYASSAMGALGSPAFWAAYGERTDGRDNTLPQYQPDYAAQDWGFFFSDVHATQPGLCSSGNLAWANWVFDFGTWIDNHLPRDTGSSSFGYKTDRYHPSVDFAFTDPDLGPVQLRYGYWDNSGSVDLAFFWNDIQVITVPNVPNGSFTVVPPLALLQLSDRIKVIATDAQGNRAIAEKTFLQMIQDWLNDPS